MKNRLIKRYYFKSKYFIIEVNMSEFYVTMYLFVKRKLAKFVDKYKEFENNPWEVIDLFISGRVWIIGSKPTVFSSYSNNLLLKL